MDIFGPTGQTTYGRRDDGTPYAQYTNLAPEQQYLYDTQMQIGHNLANQAYLRSALIPTNQFSLGGTPYDPRSYNLDAIMQPFQMTSYPRDMSMVGGNPFGQSTGQYGMQQPGFTGGKGAPQQPPSPYGAPSPDSPGVAGSPTQEQIAAQQQYDRLGMGVDRAAQAQWGQFDSQRSTARSDFYRPQTTTISMDEWNAYNNRNRPATQAAGPQSAVDQQYGTSKGASQQPPGGGDGGGSSAQQQAYNGWMPPEDTRIVSTKKNKKQGTVDVTYAGIDGRFVEPGFQAGEAPQGFDADYYSQQVGLDDPSQAWSHYVQNSRGQQNYRPGFSFGGNAPQGGAQQQQLPPAGGANPAAVSGMAPGPQGAPQGQMGVQGGPQYNNGQLPIKYPNQNPNVLPYDPRSYGNIDMFRENVQDAVYDQQMRNLKPTFDMQYERQIQDLANRGIPPGSAAWNSAIGELNRNQGNAYQQAANQAIAAAGGEANRLMGMEQQLRGTAFSEALGLNQLANSQGIDRINLEQTLRDRAIQNQLLERTQMFNEASALLQGAPALTMPNTPQMPTYQMQAVNAADIINQGYQNQLGYYNMQAQQAAAGWQGAGQIAGSVASIAAKCARKYKHDDGPAERILDRLQKVPVRTWRYRPEIEPQQPLHLSPYAEDFHNAFGLGNGDEIPLIDLCGVLMKSLQELKEEVDALKKERESRRKTAARRRSAAK